ncbi:MAG: ferrous iron transport protein B [bacterium]
MKAKRQIKVAIAGNPNSGKSTIFNALTGRQVAVGNWPGVTVERQEGKSIYQGHEVRVIDLPGTYALDAWTVDERIAREFLLTEDPDGIVAVVDASNLERNLYLVVQLLEMGARVVLVLNMMDIARERGLEVDIKRLGAVLGVTVVPTVAATGEGIAQLRAVIHNLGQQKDIVVPLRIDYGTEIERGIERVAAALLDNLQSCSTVNDRVRDRSFVDQTSKVRWWALKLLEGECASGEMARAGKVAEAVRAELALRHKHDAGSAIVERRYGFIRGVLRECVRVKPDIARGLFLSETIDNIVLNRWLGVPLFLLLMVATFYIVFALGSPLAELISQLFQRTGELINTGLILIHAPEWLGSLLTDGLIAGIGTVLSFTPNIAILYLIISLLEDSGYMARAAFVMDRFMHLFGLHGKSFIPLIMGFGCNVPAILAARTLESRKDRILTIIVNPLISCSARLPIYVLFTAVFFPRHRGLVVFSLYAMGIILAVLVARVCRRLFFRAEVAPLIMELPPYHTPTLRTVLRPTWVRTFLFIRRAGIIIAPAVVVVWILARLPWGVAYASEESILGKIGSGIAPVLKPAGFGYWWAAVSLIAGVVAKEVVIGTMATIHGLREQGLLQVIRSNFTPLSAYAFMVMSLLYLPCVATFSAIRRELGWRWAGFVAAYTLVLGWLTATVIYQIGRVFS